MSTIQYTTHVSYVHVLMEGEDCKTIELPATVKLGGYIDRVPATPESPEEPGGAVLAVINLYDDIRVFIHYPDKVVELLEGPTYDLLVERAMEEVS